jgi:heptosyltransferase-2
MAFGKELRSRRYDIWVSAHQSLRSAFIAGQSKAELRIGYDTPKLNRIFFTSTVPRGFPERHEVDRLLQLARGLGITVMNTWPEIELPAEVREKAMDFFRPLKSRPTLGLHPGSIWATKRWPVEYFAQIAVYAIEKGARIMLFAGPGEEEIADGMLKEIQRLEGGICKIGNDVEADIVNLSGRLSIPELAAYIAELNCYVSNDSGPMHMAWAQRVPLVALFGPTVRELGFDPRGPNSVLLEAQGLDCRPCGLHGPQVCPRGHHRCMRDLTPGKVWPEVERRLFWGMA